VSSAKYLGITVQSNLKWDKHINNITSKGNEALGFLKRNLKTSNQQIKTQAYHISDGTATRWNDTLYIITNLVRSLRFANDGKLILLSISDKLLVLWSWYNSTVQPQMG
jgi:uncharacterized membrane-anchored protein